MRLTRFTVLIGIIAMVLFQATARATTMYVFKVTPSVTAVTDGTAGLAATHFTLTANDMINLALGQPLTTRVDPHTEVLGLATTFENGTNNFGVGRATLTGTSAVSTLIVFNPSQSGTAQVTTTIATLNFLSWSEQETKALNSGQGIASGTFLTTTMGNSAQNGFINSPFNGSGTCSGPHINFTKHIASPHGSAVFVSPIQFNYTPTGKPTVKFNGYITNGMLSISGNFIGTYDLP